MKVYLLKEVLLLFGAICDLVFLLAMRTADLGLLFKIVLQIQGYGIPSVCLWSHLCILSRDIYTELATGLTRVKKRMEIWVPI